MLVPLQNSRFYHGLCTCEGIENTMERTPLALRILELVALLLPALGIYFRFFLNNNSPNDDFELKNIHHDLTTSAWMLLTIGSVLIVGFLAVFILIFDSDDIYVKLVGFLLFVAFMAVTHMSHDWYLNNLRRMRNSLEDLIETSQERKEQLENFEEEINEINLKNMSYFEKRELLEDLKDISEDFVRFNPSGNESAEKMVQELNIYLPKRQKELEIAINESEDLKNNVDVLPSLDSVIYSIQNPVEYIRNGSLIIPWMTFWVVSEIVDLEPKYQWFGVGVLVLVLIIQLYTNRGEEEIELKEPLTKSE